MLKIRLQRVGRKREPSFRVVLTDSKNSTKSGKTLEVIGSYDPRFNNPVINADRVKHWMSVGAQVTDTVHNILVGKKIIDGKKKNVLPKKSPIVKEPTAEEKAAAEEAAKAAAAAAAPKAEVPADAPAPETTPEAQ